MKLSAFIFDASWEPDGLHLFGRSEVYGVIECRFTEEPLVFFVSRSTTLPRLNLHFSRKETTLTTFSGEAVDGLYFQSVYDYRMAEKRLTEKNIRLFESDIKPERRFLMERFIHAEIAVKGEPLLDANRYIFINPKITAFESQVNHLKMASLDIETGVRSGQLYSIAVHGTFAQNEDRIVFMLNQTTRPLAKDIYGYGSEKDLLIAFLHWFQNYDPDVIIGWNVVGFDLNFLLKKCHEFELAFTMGRLNDAPRIWTRGSGNIQGEIKGRVIVDGPFALRSAFYHFENFKLETVAQQLLGEGKDIASDENKIAEIERQFAHDKLSLAAYNLKDCELVTRIFEKTGLMDLLMTRSKLSGMLLKEIGSSTGAFDHYMLPRIHRKGFVSINVDDVQKSVHTAGGFVFEPTVGIHEDVLILDFKSLYPSIIKTFKIDPYALLKKDVQPISTPEGFTFSSTEHFLPELIRELMAQREKAKTKENSYLSQAIKILMNSLYGVMGSYVSRFYHPDLPGAVTTTGHFLLKESKKYLEENGFEVIYGDTDSVFVKPLNKTSSDVHEMGQTIADELNLYWKQRLFDEFNVESFLELEYEKYYEKLLLPGARHGEGGAKKRYAGFIKSDRVTVFTGMEFVRSDWTQLAKEFQYTLYTKIFLEEPIDEWIREQIQLLKSGKFDSKLIYKKRLRKKAETYIKHVPPHVKAAKLLKKFPRRIEYIITKKGPVPVQLQPTDFDYTHYIEKQLQPVADSILPFIGTDFNRIIDQQTRLFDF